MLKTFDQESTVSDTVAKNSRYKYSSVQYSLPAFIRKKIFDWGFTNIPVDSLYNPADELGYGLEKQHHVTVFYGIHTDNITPIRNLLRLASPFIIKLDKVSCFTAPEQFDVVKIDVISDELHKLHNHIKKNLANTEAFPHFSPHVTIAYIRKDTRGKYCSSNEFEGLTLMVSKLEFSSHGNIKATIDLR